MHKQKMVKPLLKASWIIGALFLVGCGGSPEQATPEETYSVFDGDEIVSLSSKIVPCSYVGFNQQVTVEGCYAAEDSKTRYQTYSDIEGLDLSWGTQYLVHLEYWKASDEIADGPQVIAKVKEIISQQEDPAGTQYEYHAIKVAFVFDSNQRFLNHTWQCALSEGCDWILNSGTSLIDLTFEKQTDGSMLLIAAEIPSENENPSPPDETYTVYDGEEVVILGSKIESCSYMGIGNYIHIKGCYAPLNEVRHKRYGDVVGLQPIWGVTSEVIIEHWKTPHEIADAPEYKFKLKEIINQQEDPAGTRYEYQDVVIAYTFTNTKDWKFLGEDWTCGLEEGCDWLNSPDSLSKLNLIFEKQASGPMLLIEAEFAPSE